MARPYMLLTIALLLCSNSPPYSNCFFFHKSFSSLHKLLSLNQMFPSEMLSLNNIRMRCDTNGEVVDRHYYTHQIKVSDNITHVTLNTIKDVCHVWCSMSLTIWNYVTIWPQGVRLSLKPRITFICNIL